MYYTYSLGLIVLTTIISVTLQNMTTTSKPLSRSVKRFSQMGFIEYLGKKLNVRLLLRNVLNNNISMTD